jgi:hypothetical protein
MKICFHISNGLLRLWEINVQVCLSFVGKLLSISNNSCFLYLFWSEIIDKQYVIKSNQCFVSGNILSSTISQFSCLQQY